MFLVDRWNRILRNIPKAHLTHNNDRFKKKNSSRGPLVYIYVNMKNYHVWYDKLEHTASSSDTTLVCKSIFECLICQEPKIVRVLPYLHIIGHLNRKPFSHQLQSSCYLCSWDIIGFMMPSSINGKMVYKWVGTKSLNARSKRLNREFYVNIF